MSKELFLTSHKYVEKYHLMTKDYYSLILCLYKKKVSCYKYDQINSLGIILCLRPRRGEDIYIYRSEMISD
jgi:hypothetical protein